MGGTVEVALRWRGTSGEPVHGYANSRLTPEGGTHVEGFREGLTAAVDACARQQGRLLCGWLRCRYCGLRCDHVVCPARWSASRPVPVSWSRTCVGL